jgi:hypothetical protein
MVVTMRGPMFWHITPCIPIRKNNIMLDIRRTSYED